MLIKNYYTIKKRENAIFFIELNEDCEVYKGHFPEKAVSPGVCNLQMIKECAEEISGCSLMMNNLQLCRLTTLVTPSEHKNVEVKFSVFEETEENVQVRATLGKGDEIYLDLKAQYLKI